jgi:hypothetical protein
MSKMWPGLDETSASGVLVELLDAVQQGKVGTDLVRVIRSTFQKLAREGWNETPLDSPTILEAAVDAFWRYRDGRIMLEEEAIQAMLAAIDEGDFDRGREIQLAIWERRTTIHPFVPVSLSVFSVPQPEDLKDRLKEVYDEEQAEQAISANSATVGYLGQETLEPLEDRGFESAFEQAKDIDKARISTAADEIEVVIDDLVRGKDVSEQFKVIKRATNMLNDLEKARILNWLGMTPAGWAVIYLVEFLDVNLDDDDVYQSLVWEWPIPLADWDETGRADVLALARLISVPPESPKWAPQHGEGFIIASGSLTSREPLRDCLKAGWAWYTREENRKKRKLFSKRHRIGRMTVRVVDEDGFGDGNGRFVKYDRAAIHTSHLKHMLRFDKGTLAPLLGEMRKYSAAEAVLEVLQ